LKENKKKSWKWKGICGNYTNPILESNVGKTSFDNKRKTCKTKVVPTTNMVRREVWIGGLQKRHNYKRKF
jgi:hypothetical protein